MLVATPYLLSLLSPGYHFIPTPRKTVAHFYQPHFRDKELRPSVLMRQGRAVCPCSPDLFRALKHVARKMCCKDFWVVRGFCR